MAEQLVNQIITGEALPSEKDLKKHVLRRADGAVDIAMFGRMLADSPDYNRDAAVQVAHAVTTHAAYPEEDWFSAIDDLSGNEAGASHLGETYFGSGVFYQYVCVNCDLLIENLNGDRELAEKGIAALVKAVALSTPTGKQNSFASRPLAHYLLAEAGQHAPRDLSGAFFSPIKAQPWLENSVDALKKARQDIDTAYGKVWDASSCLHVGHEGTLDSVVAFAARAVQEA